MGPHLLGCSSLLLLLLGMWWSVRPLCAVPKGLTRARWFEIQHIQSSPVQCNRAMSGVNNYTQHCKPTNSFLNSSFQDVTAVCNLPNITCRNGSNNCHQSSNRVNVTLCDLISGRYPTCRYHDKAQYNKFFIVACNPPQKTDPPYRLVPVHLDEVF
ncbi:ribonuclease K6-like [Oryx dammah]|uniref:ribonuclease K6-like n=1 Tax=Oryx dammah TaxID=59534 RepID=UPI001A9B8786|nr:ribonuclease K6-like [Oryx dammah]